MKNVLKKNTILKLFSKYAIVGIINTIVGLSTIYILFWWFNLSHNVATFLGNSLGIICSYFLNRGFTFQHKGRHMRSAILFVCISLLCYYIAYILLHQPLNVLVDVFDVERFQFLSANRMNIIIILEAGLYTVFSFVMHKAVTFRQRIHDEVDTNPYS